MQGYENFCHLALYLEHVPLSNECLRGILCVYSIPWVSKQTEHPVITFYPSLVAFCPSGYTLQQVRITLVALVNCSWLFHSCACRTPAILRRQFCRVVKLLSAYMSNLMDKLCDIISCRKKSCRAYPEHLRVRPNSM